MTHPLDVAAVSNGDVDGTTGVNHVSEEGIGALIGMHVAEECEVDSILVQHVLNLLLEALHLLVVAVVCVVAAQDTSFCCMSFACHLIL